MPATEKHNQLRPQSRRDHRLAAVTLASMDLVAAAGTAAFLLAPPSASLPVRAIVLCGVLLLALALATVTGAGRLSGSALLLLAGARLTMAVLLVSVAAASAGRLAAAGAFVWLQVWVVVFFDLRTLRFAWLVGLLGALAAAALNADHLGTLADLCVAGCGGAVGALTVHHVLAGLRSQVRRDHLTGLLNRFGLEQRLAERDRRGHESQTMSLVLIDLDGFKAVNDREGHAAGDALLVAFGDELEGAAAAATLTARVGGDEFVAILPGADEQGAQRWAAELALGSCVRWSFGVAQRTADEPFPLWLARADRLMYAAKSSRREGRGTQLTPALSH